MAVSCWSNLLTAPAKRSVIHPLKPASIATADGLFSPPPLNGTAEPKFTRFVSLTVLLPEFVIQMLLRPSMARAEGLFVSGYWNWPKVFPVELKPISWFASWFTTHASPFVSMATAYGPTTLPVKGLPVSGLPNVPSLLTLPKPSAPAAYFAVHTEPLPSMANDLTLMPP